MMRLFITGSLILLLALAGCGDSDENVTSEARMQSSGEMADHHGHDHAPAADEARPATLTGKVLETMDSGGYTYVKVEGQDGAFWAAASPTEVEVGDEVTVSTAMPMRNFRAESLDRTFDLIFFTNTLKPGAGHGMGSLPDMPGMGGMASGHGKPAAVQSDVDLSGIEKAAGGHTVAELHAKPAEFAGKSVIVRGKVVKYTGGIMGRNWIHLRDGTGDAQAGTHDMTVTTQGFAKVGDLVRVEGTLAANKDFGAGYRYDVIIENANVIKE